MNLAGIIGDIYEAAVVPDLWMRTLRQTAEIAGGEGAMLFAQSRSNIQIIHSPELDEVIRTWVSDGWVARNERGDRLIPLTDPRFHTDLDAFTLEEMERSPFYTEFLRSFGLGWCAGTSIHSPTADTIVLSIERAFAKGPVERDRLVTLDALRPHIARAALLSAQAGLERVRSNVLALASVGLPAAVLTPARRVIAANTLMEKLAPSVRIGGGDLLTFENQAAQVLFAEAARSRASEGPAKMARSFPLPSNGISAPAVAHLLPLQGQGRDIFTGASSLLYVTSLSRHAALPSAILQALFDLTPAEARVANLIGSGHSATETGRRLDVQINTVRTHLKAIYAKTGARRQADIVDIVAARLHPDAEP